ncbi:ABC transporter ATP-binding protein/permease [Robinsoniella sp. KNHs210]|uniref:ABC transporter ATP-binding protein/permease n=1 Tax=Robinsoniella sp. KNHs210 TaxID=1469950 RepID=UPI00047FA91E|nr:ABC transporter ATP-binding protein/permease [Robinsoniella sp. KNHs210]
MIKTRLVGLLADSKKYIIQNVLWQWVALIANISAAATVGNLIEKTYRGMLGTELLAVSACILAVSVLIRFGCDRLAAKASFLASRDVKITIREKIYEKLLRLGASYKEKISTAEVVQVSVEGVEQLEIYFGKYLPQLFYSLLAPLTLFAVLSFISLKACIVLLICVPLIPASIMGVQKFAKKLLNKYWGSYTELGDSFLENLQGLTTLKIYQADGKKAEEMDKESEQFRRVTMRVLTMQLNSISVMDLVAYGGAAIGMIVAVREYIAGNIGLAGTVTLILLAAEFFIPLRVLGSFFHIAMNGMAASDKMFRLLDLQETKNGQEEVPKQNHTIRFKDAGFCYDSERKILDHVNLTISKGSIVSLVGNSGCGKSTLAAILTSRNKGYEGSITIGGKELSDISEASLMSHITMVGQNSYLFKGTVEENLAMGNPSASKEQMDQVLKDVDLYEFLYAGQGLNTQLQEKASNLSGGQQQRLALARALLHDSEIYIFDEATSNIDVESEERIMSVIYGLAGHKTVLLISHRLQNVVSSDYIYVLQNGKIAESGSHENLLGNAGVYAKLYENQQQLEQYRQKEGAEYAS